MEIPIVVVLTRPPHESRRNFSYQDALQFDSVLQKAIKTEFLPNPSGSETVNQLEQKLVDEVDLLLTVSDETETPPAGDTVDLIAYARHRGRHVISISETSNGVVVQDLAPEHDPAKPQESIHQLEKMLEEAPPPPKIPEQLIAYFEACDEQATNTAPRVRRYVLNIVLANAIASIAGGIGSSFHHSATMGTALTVIKFGCFFLGLIIFAVLRHRQSQNRWLGFRLKAEVCRSTMATWNSPVPIEPLSTDEVPELRPLIQSTRYFRALGHRGRVEITMAAFKADYGKRRLIDQFHYFQRQAQSANSMSARLTPLYWALSGGALLISGLSLVIPSLYGPGHHLDPWLNYFFIVVPILAPAIASWIIAWQAIEAVSRKRARCVEMERLMHQSLVDLIHSHSWEAVQNVVRKAERQLLMEVLEWYAFVKYSS